MYATPAADSPTGAPATANWRHPAVVLASGLWVGRIPFAPGTWGTLWGLPLAYSIAQLPGIGWQLATVVAFCAVGVPLCTVAARQLGGKKDPGCIVWDEIAAMPVTFFLVPPEAMNRPMVLAAGFVLFRFFDIVKLPPARQLEGLPNGLGIMADDIAAAVLACVALHGLLWLGWI